MNIIDIMADDLKLDSSYILKIANRSDFYYKDYTIKKKNGGFRHISQPSPELKTLQYWIVKNILCKLPISNIASAYNKGNSIKKHAQIHSGAKHILHTDINNFFPSIHFSHLSSILFKHKYIFENLSIDINDSLPYISKICFRGDGLSIGAVSSPIISNIIMNSFDERLYDYCKANNYLCSRYADDIYISSNSYINDSVVVFISNLLDDLDMSINSSKTRFYSTKYRMSVTGLIITNDSRITIGSKRRSEIEKMVYNKIVNGIGDKYSIMGYLAFLKDIEPNTYNNLIIKYSKYCDGDVINKILE